MFINPRTIFSFIDVLACALGSSIVLMLIFSVTRQGAGPPAGSPRDYIYYEVSIENDEGALIRPVLKRPDADWEAAGLSSDGEVVVGNDGFIQMENIPPDQIFLWGPSRPLKSATGVRTYHIYVTRPIPGRWQIGILYYSSRDLQDPIDPRDIDDQAGKSIRVTHSVRTRLGAKTYPSSSVGLGKFNTVHVDIP